MRRSLSPHILVLLVSAFLMLGYNQGLWHGIMQANDHLSLHNLLFVGSCAIFLTALFNFLFGLFAYRRVIKPLLILVVVTAASASYFIDNYAVHIDSSMLQNVMETDSSEASELISTDFLLHMLFWGVLPALVISRVKLNGRHWHKQTIVNAFSVTMSILAIGLSVSYFYQDYASTVRNHRELRYLINPTSYIYAVGKMVGQHFAAEDKPLVPISQHAALGFYAKAKANRTVTVMVVGETARAEQFHMNGYKRETSPLMEKQPVINFDKVSSCGTATAVSLPCMFSVFPRDDYNDDRGHGYESVLDVVAKAGTPVVWLDNNSGCKGVCDRVTEQKVDHLKLPEVCNDDGCFDEVLLQRLKKVVTEQKGDVLVVLHQKGSHGPAYYKRVPDNFKKFGPECVTTELQECSQQEITNAYDNTILYTDYVLSGVVDYLQGLADSNTNTAMLYMSDHGESLGEHNLYLHGTPYFMAPSQQTHVPMMLWLSDSFKQDYQLDGQCLIEQRHDELSHDNLFHSMLGMMDIQLPDRYDPGLDIFSRCRQGSPSI